MSTIKEVASRAGVAVSTVSKVIKNYPNVSEETRKKVTQAIEELQYTPNTVASALSSKATGRVALLVNLHDHTQAIDEITMQYLHGAISVSKEIGLDVITVFFSMIAGKTIGEMEQYFNTQNIKGIIIFGVSKDDGIIHELIEKMKFKIVVIDAPFENENTSNVQIDHKNAQIDVMKKTINGHDCKKILYIKGKENGYVTANRLDGMMELAKKKKIKYIIANGEFSELKAREATFLYADEVDVIVCASDLMAIGAMKALIELDIFRPVCGFDGITLMGYVGKQMNTVKQDFFGIAREAAIEMDRLLKGGIGQSVIVPYELERLEYLEIIR